MSKKSEIEKALEAERIKEEEAMRPKADTIPTQVPTTESPKSGSTAPAPETTSAFDATPAAPAEGEGMSFDPEAMVFIPSEQYEKALATIEKQDKAIEKAAEMFDRLIDRFGALADSVSDVKDKVDAAAARTDAISSDLDALEEQVDEIHDTLLDLCDDEDEEEAEEIVSAYARRLPDGSLQLLNEEELAERGLKNPGDETLKMDDESDGD